MSVEAPTIVARAREAAKEQGLRKERTWGLRERAVRLLQEHPTEFYTPRDIFSRFRSPKPIPILRTTFGEGEEEVEVVISPRNPFPYGEAYERNLNEAEILIEVGRQSSLSFLPKKYGFPDRHSLPDNDRLDLYEGLLTTIEEQVGAK